MNIFILSEQTDPRLHHCQNAEFHCDKHVVKMIAESTQMLVTAFPRMVSHYVPDSLVNSLVNNMPCNPLGTSMSKHPCMEWVKKDILHFNYLALLAWQLCCEHQYRYPLSPQHAYSQWLEDLVILLESKGLGYDCPIPTHFAVAVKDEKLRSVETSHIKALDIYRRYYFKDKQGFASWKKRQKPVWWILLEDIQDSKSI
jgi:hypothetical protein